jgi:glycosyltransferase involved in cell wall biosynthesis
MNERPLVSVVIPAYNNAQYVTQAVDSALTQTYSPVEIIVVDDGSTDNTAELLAGYRERISFVRQENRGPAGARNAGIRQARGELLAFLDSDDLWFPEKLERQVPVFLKNPRVGVVHSDWLRLDRGADGYRPSTRPHHECNGNCYHRLFFDNCVHTSTAVLAQACVDKVGLFDEGIRGCEDYDLWIRVSRYYEFAYVAQPLAVYRKHSTNITLSLLGMEASWLAAVRKMLQADPSLWQTIGKEKVEERLVGLLRGLGYLHYDQGNFTEAHRLFAEGLSYRVSPFLCLLWFATLFPPPLIQRLRSVKHWWKALSTPKQRPQNPAAGEQVTNGK